MDGISRMAAGSVCVRSGSSWLNVRPLTLGDIASCESKILIDDRNPIEDAKEAFDRAGIRCKALIERAIDECRKRKELRVVPASHFHHWLYTPAGISYSLFLCVDEFPDPSHAAAKATDDLVRARDIVSSLDDLSSLDWPEGSPGLKGKFIPWRRIYKTFAESNNWSPAVVNSLTLYQLRVYSMESIKEGVGAKPENMPAGDDIMTVLKRREKA